MQLPNALAFDERGNLYVTDSGARFSRDGTVIRLAPGRHADIWTESVPAFPNGYCLNAAGDVLYVVQTDAPGLYAVAILADGRVGSVDCIAGLPGTVPDGVATASDGSVYVSCYRPDAIYRIEGGTTEMVAHDPLGWIVAGPTSLAFGGPDLAQLVVPSFNQYHLSLGDVAAPRLRPRYPTLD